MTDTLGIHDFQKLLSQSRQLTAQVSSSTGAAGGLGIPLPSLQRGLEQLDALSCKLATQTGKPQAYSDLERIKGLGSIAGMRGSVFGKLDELDVSTALLAVQASLDDAAAAARFDDTDVEGFLLHQQEINIMKTIERVREETEKRIKATTDQKMQRDWERAKKTLLEQRGLATQMSDKNLSEKSPSLTASLAPTAVHDSKSQAFANVVGQLNEARLQKNDFPLAAQFAKVTRSVETDLRSDLIVDCWQTVSLIANEQDLTTDSPNVFVQREGLGAHYLSDDARWKTRLVSGSLRFLENMFVHYVERTISQHPRDAMLGGRPGFLEKIRAFMNVRIKRMASEEIGRLEMVSGAPIYAHLYYLVRCGYWREALAYSQSLDTYPQRSERNLGAYLKAYIDSGSLRTLPASLRGQIQSDYGQRVMAGNNDPYKMALIKILGRCEVNRKTMSDVIQTSEDYIWLQLHLINEEQGSGYRLAGLQKLVNDYGPEYFSGGKTGGTSVFHYFHILLLTGQFEQAISILYEAGLLMEATHFAIALTYHGLLRMVEQAEPDSWQIFTKHTAGDDRVSEINYAALIIRHSKFLQHIDLLEAVQYLFLLTLPNRLAYDNLCRAMIRDFALESGNVSTLFGDIRPDGNIAPGYLSTRLSLLRLASPAEFMREITLKAAEKCERDENRLTDALQLFNLASEYERVIMLLNTRLGKAYASPYQQETSGELAAMTKAVFDYYSADSQIAGKIEGKTMETCAALLKMMEMHRACAESSWSAALSLSEELGIVPMESDVNHVSRAVEQFKTYADPITLNLAEILLETMTALHHSHQSLKEFVYIDPGRQQVLGPQSYLKSPIIANDNDSKEIKGIDDVCGDDAVSCASRCMCTANAPRHNDELKEFKIIAIK